MDCDIRIAAEDTQLGFPEVRANVPVLTADAILYYIPDGIAREMLLVGDSISAQRAYEVSLVNRVVSRGATYPHSHCYGGADLPKWTSSSEGNERGVAKG